MDDSARVRAVRIAVVLALAAGFLLTHRLWIGPREFPMAPFLGFDQMRLQPWLFQGAFLLGFLLFARPSSALSACRIVIAGTYLWSGLQKLNGPFADVTFPWLMGDVPLPPHAGMLSAIAEAGIGLALLHRKTRDLAVVAAVVMHLLILARLSAHGWNTAVWPWNLMMIVAVVALFRRADAAGFEALVPKRGRRAELAAWVFFIAMPFLSIFGAWDSYLSSSLYTSAISDAWIHVPATHAARLPASARDVAAPTSEGVRVGLLVWAMRDLNTPVYPEPRVFKEIARRTCAELDDPPGMTLVIWHRFTALHPARVESLTCAELAGTKTGP